MCCDFIQNSSAIAFESVKDKCGERDRANMFSSFCRMDPPMNYELDTRQKEEVGCIIQVKIRVHRCLSQDSI